MIWPLLAGALMRYLGVLLTLVLSAFLAGSGPGSPLQASQNARAVVLTRIIRIPIHILKTGGAAENRENDAASLTVSPGGTDELPEGPNGFDVFEDGRVLITDPLARRVAVFDAKGTFLRSWQVGFAADSVKRVGKDSFLIRQANTGELHAFDSDGHERSGQKVALPPESEVQLNGLNRGTVSRPATGDFHGGQLTIQFDTPQSRLISLEWLATDRSGNTYVALESTTGEAETSDESINLNKGVMKYGPDGKLVAQIATIPLDYYIPPVDELRVAKGMVYQLFTTQSEVRINVWSME